MSLPIIGFFFSTTLTLSSILLAKNYHSEREKLVKLNKIVNNKHSKVAHGSQKDQILTSIQKYNSLNHEGNNTSEEEPDEEEKL